ncbi:response regulator transcription factor [Noviherbaspirillum galbum]|uniref:Response regulator n=1 Tax=Noviherbaspirillum galbum TaxID=2709383 RepID=A0A6B3SS58_9BURK|nr:response regulator [Noviherbaspirillum galbum]NEX63587.1 response regulator [Noviherbaspirillum galbum]
MTNMPSGSPTFMIIDDNDVSRLMPRHILHANKYTVVGEAASGRVGIELMERLRPKLVCLDIMLPDMSGIDVLRTIRSSGWRAEVLMVTGSNDRGTVMEAVARLQGGSALA